MLGLSSTNPRREKLTATLAGLTAALFWSLAVAGGRLLTEAFGGMLSVALIHLTAAVFSLLYLVLSPRARRAVALNSRKYTLGCGALFILYILMFYQALNLASSREQVVIVGIINYLWPALSLALSIPVLGNRTSLTALFAANGLALSGVGLAIVSAGGYSTAMLIEEIRSDLRPYLPALAAAVSWALYNNLSRRWGATSAGGSVAIFIIALAILTSPFLIGSFDRISWSGGVLGILLVVAVFPTFLAYFFWDLAQRKGHHATVNSIAYAIPVLSTLTTCLLLKIRIPLMTWLGCLLVIVGAVLSRLVIVEKSDCGDQRNGLTLGAIIELNTGPLRSFLSGITADRLRPGGR